MKRKLLTVIAVFTIAFLGNAQDVCLNDTIIRYDYTTGTSIKNKVGFTVNEFNNQNETVKSTYYWYNESEDSYTPSYRTSYEYDENGNMTEEYRETYYANWLDNYKRLFTYENNLRTKETIQSTNPDGDLENAVRYVFTYENDSLQTEIKQFWVEPNWVNEEREVYTRDEDGYIITYLEQSWDGTIWEDEAKIEATYTEDNEFETLIGSIWHFADLEWKKYSKIEYTHSSTTTEAIHFKWDEALEVYELDYKELYTHNSNKQVISSLFQEWDKTTTSWVNDFRYTFDYEGDVRTLYLYEIWDDVDNAWDKIAKNETVVDEDGNILTVDYYGGWNSTSQYWSTQYQEAYFYTCGELGISTENLDFVNVYPNPMADRLNIATTKSGEFTIYSISGEVVKTFNVSESKSIDVSKLNSGIYFLKLNGHGGSKKLIKR